MRQGPARVLDALRNAGATPLSGESLSAVLGVSRNQIWKHVESLRRRDYRIEGEPGGGYRLCGVPDRLYPEEIALGLDTRWLGRRIEYFESTDSTNRVALDLARAGAAHGTAVIAETQTAGRGRLGRSYFSPPYVNLYTSIVLRPQLTTAAAPTLILAAAIAVADAVAQTVDAPEAVEIKWPNDVLIGGRKTSGILMEMNAEATSVRHAILGIGVNLNVDRASFPDEFREHATSLKSESDSGQPVDRAAFTRLLYSLLEGVLDEHAQHGFEGLRGRFEARFRMTGRRVRVLELGDTPRVGVARGLASDGALLVETTSGNVERVVAGDVTIAKEELSS